MHITKDDVDDYDDDDGGWRSNAVIKNSKHANNTVLFIAFNILSVRNILRVHKHMRANREYLEKGGIMQMRQITFKYLLKFFFLRN